MECDNDEDLTTRHVMLTIRAPKTLSDERVLELIGEVIDVGMADANETRNNLACDEKQIKEADEAWSICVEGSEMLTEAWVRYAKEESDGEKA